MPAVLVRLVIVAGWLAVCAGLHGCAGVVVVDDPPAGSSFTPVSFTYPYQVEQLWFPRDEGKHPLSQRPITLVEWYAVYAHLTAVDGTRYLLFTTFVTYDPVELVLGNRFPHEISTLIDVTHNTTYHHTSMAKLREFAEGHADAETFKGDYFRWKGADRPFEYDFHVAWDDAQIDCSADLHLKMIKPPLAVGGGHVKQPQGDSGYYSQTRIEAAGELTLGGKGKRVSGVAWVDRQWLGTPTDKKRYTYDWWALQLDNHEEAIMYRIWDQEAHAIVSTLLEISHVDGTREHVDKFTLTDTPTGWRLAAPRPDWNLTLACVAPRHQPAGGTAGGFLGATWYSCDVSGTAGGRRISGLAVAELVPNSMGNVSAAVWNATTVPAGTDGKP